MAQHNRSFTVLVLLPTRLYEGAPSHYIHRAYVTVPSNKSLAEEMAAAKEKALDEACKANGPCPGDHYRVISIMAGHVTELIWSK